MSHSFDSLVDLLRSYGVRAGHRIAIRLPNCQLLIDLIFASWEIGANICPLNVRVPNAQIELLLDRLQPKLYISEEGFFSRDGAESEIHSSIFLFTSGSTGIPTIAVLSQESLLTNAKAVAAFVDLKKEDRWLLSLPLFHVGGIGILLRCRIVGAKITFDPHDPEITHLSFVPTMLFRATPLYKNLKCLLLGGAPINHIPQSLPICLTYGMTEMGSTVTTNRFLGKDLHFGHPLPNREIKVADDGEILVRGSCLFKGYWDDGRLFLPLKDGWFQTGDLGDYSKSRGLLIRGRKDWQFISGGENIQPEEIESALLTCPEVQEAVVIPRPDPEFGFRPVAFVRSSHKEFSLEKMKHFLSDLLPKYKIPVALHFVDEFPRKGLKIDRKTLIINNMNSMK